MKTLYYLVFKENRHGDVYHVYETHCGTGKGCFLTNETYIASILKNEDRVNQFIEEFENELIEGKIDGISFGNEQEDWS